MEISDLSYCSAFGETPVAALQELEIAKKLWLEAAQAEGKPIPLPTYRSMIDQAS
ncbi:MAG: type II toxin-antitoxin system HicB family antitoxin [Cyanobacteriota bacterium]|jgi:predicted RNase H-like HicB family nuclease